MSVAASSIWVLFSIWRGSLGLLAGPPCRKSGARATKPASAKRSTTARTWGTRPHQSWMTMTAGLAAPPEGIARYPSLVPPLPVKLTISPIGPSS